MTHALVTTPQAAESRLFGLWAAYGSLVIAIAGFPVISTSDTRCVDNSGSLAEPGNTLGTFAVVLAPLLAIAALVLLRRARRAGAPRSRLATAAAILVFPVVLLDCFVWAVSAAFACGIGFM